MSIRVTAPAVEDDTAVPSLVLDDVWGQRAPWAEEPEGTRHTRAGPPLPR